MNSIEENLTIYGGIFIFDCDVTSMNYFSFFFPLNFLDDGHSSTHETNR